MLIGKIYQCPAAQRIRGSLRTEVNVIEIKPLQKRSMSVQRAATAAVRLALAAAFLSAVADRFGMWGPPGSAHAAWGDWLHFSAYVAKLNPLAPPWLIPILAWSATLAEIGLALLLLIGYKLRWVAYASAALLFLFAMSMTIALGVKAPLDYSVFTAAAAAFLMAVTVKANR